MKGKSKMNQTGTRANAPNIQKECPTTQSNWLGAIRKLE